MHVTQLWSRLIYKWRCAEICNFFLPATDTGDVDIYRCDYVSICLVGFNLCPPFFPRILARDWTIAQLARFAPRSFIGSHSIAVFRMHLFVDWYGAICHEVIYVQHNKTYVHVAHIHIVMFLVAHVFLSIRLVMSIVYIYIYIYIYSIWEFPR